jgi:hypothetical protein
MSWRASRRSRAVRRAACVGLLVAAASASAQTTDVALGIEALARRDLKGAEALFARGTRSPNPSLRATAWQWRGHVAWKFRGDYTRASRYLDSALAQARDSSQVLLEIARLNGARHQYRTAIRTAYDAMSRSLDAERRGGAARTLAELAVNGALAGDSLDRSVLSELRDTLASRVKRFPGRTADAGALIGVASVLRESAAVRDGLRSYFALEQIRRSFSGSIPEALKQARMYEADALFDPADRAVVAYADFLRDVRTASDSIYRAELAGSTRAGDFNRMLAAVGRRHWKALQAGQGPAEFYPGELSRQLSGRYGAYISVEGGRGFEELYFGHQLIDWDTRKDSRIVVLDQFVSSGIDEWLLDGAGGRAGWASNGIVFARYSAFTETPFRALLALTDPQTIPGETFRISRDSAGDIDRAKQDSLGYFPGVAARLFRAGALALLDSVKTAEAFTAALHRSLVLSSIYQHENRHRDDIRAGRASVPANDEFRAKIDEVTGARLPRLALTAILSPNIGDGSPHGQANRRIMIGLNRWIRRNGAAIAGYDPKQPALLQLPNLTDAQLRAAFESMRRP